MEAEDKPLRRVDLRRMAGTVDIIVVLMGISRAEEIARELIDGGLDENTPAAVIEMGGYKGSEGSHNKAQRAGRWCEETWL